MIAAAKLAVIAAAALSAPAAAGSVGVGISTDYACAAVTVQPGQSYPLGSVSVQDTGSGGETVVMSVTSLTWGPGARLAQVPASWVTFGAPQVSLSPGQMIPVPVTLHVPSGAAPGPHESTIAAIAGGSAASGQGGTVTIGAGAATRIVLTVGPSAVPPPPCAALDLAQASGKFPPWPTKAFATTGWPQVFARDRKNEPVTPDGGPTASAAANATAPQAVTTPQAVTAAYKVPSKIPSDWSGWLVIILVIGLVLRWLLKTLGVGK